VRSDNHEVTSGQRIVAEADPGSEPSNEARAKKAYLRPELARLGSLRAMTARTVSPNVQVNLGDSGSDNGDTTVQFY
jgi:hypothetical protein